MRGWVGSWSSEQIVQGHSGAEEARAYRIKRQAEQHGNLGIAQLLEFAQQQNFAVQAFELPDRMAHQHLRFDGGLRGRFAIGRLFAHEHGPKCSLAAMSAQDLEADGIEPGAEEGVGW